MVGRKGMDGWLVDGRGWMDGWLVGSLVGWFLKDVRDVVLMLSRNLRKPFVTSGRQQPPGEQPGSENHVRPAEEDQLFPMCSSVRNAALL